MILLAQREHWLTQAHRSAAHRPHGQFQSGQAMLWMMGIAAVIATVFGAATTSAGPLTQHPAIQRGAQAIQRPITPPKVPDGFPACTSGMELNRDLPRTLGETISYAVDVQGVSIGSINFRVERAGTVEGVPVTEYRSLFRLDALVSSVIPVRGQAAAIVPVQQRAPIRAMNRYTLRKDRFEEVMSFRAGASRVESARTKNGKNKEVKRSFAEPVRDFISGFYMMRALPEEANGCTVIYANQRAYTIWFEHDGLESVKTPVGMRPARRYKVRYANERSKKVLEGMIWISDDSARLPYRMRVDGKASMDAHIRSYSVARH